MIIWGEIDLNLRFKVVIAFSQNRIQMRNINENCFNKRAITIKLMEKDMRNIRIFENTYFFSVLIFYLIIVSFKIFSFKLLNIIFKKNIRYSFKCSLI